MTLEQLELEKLQKRIEQRREQLKAEESDLQPVAVSIDGGKLMYGELDLSEPEPAYTAFGQKSRYFIGQLGQWQIEMDGFVEPIRDFVTVRFGDTRSQPYEGKAFITSVQSRPITGEWVSFLQSEGPLIRHVVDTPS